MVGAVNKNNVLNNAIAQQTVKNSKDDVQKLVKYVGGEAIAQVPDTFTKATKDAVSGTLLFDGLPILNKIRLNKKTKGLGSEKFAQLDKKTFDNVRNLFKGEGKLSQRITDFVSNNTKIRNEFEAVGALNKAANKSTKAATKATKAVEKAAEKIAKAENGGLFSRLSANRAVKKAAKASAKAKNARYNFLKTKFTNTATEASKQSGKVATKLNKLGNMAKNGKFGKVGIGAEKVASKIGGGISKAGSKLGGFGKVLKSSGAGIMLVFSGVIEGLTEVVPTFKELGAKKGMKQAGKSAVKVAGDTAGFVVGNQVGTALGAAAGSALAGTKAGAAIGSVFPGYGTAIGAVVGCICGFLGSWVAGKVTKKITGKSEREKAKEAQEKQQADAIANNSKSLEQLKAEAALKIQQEYQTTGKISKDSEEALKILENLEKTNPYQVA